MTTGWFVRTSSYSADIQRVASGLGVGWFVGDAVDPKVSVWTRLHEHERERVRVFITQAALSPYIINSHDRMASFDIYQLFPPLLLNLFGMCRVLDLYNAHMGDASSRRLRSPISGRPRVSANVGNRLNPHQHRKLQLF